LGKKRWNKGWIVPIISLNAADTALIHQCAELLVVGFQHQPDVWDTLDEALDEVHAMLTPERILRVMVDDGGTALGWIGGIPAYSGNVWELHPLVVRPNVQKRGIGRALVLDFEAQVKSRGGLTIQLGTDDITYSTSLGGVDLYPNPLEHLARIRNLKGHPYEFYQKCGYVLIGVMPDANGRGKPDIYMGKKIT
jgi:aminoglycoside 6'-N-acetyltransferase I